VAAQPRTSGNAGESASGNIVIDTPNDAEIGDVLIARIAYAGTTGFTVPAGWTQIAVQNSGNTNDTKTGAVRSLLVAGILLTSAPAASYTFTRTGGSAAVGRISNIRGVYKANPFGVAASSTDGSVSSTVTQAGITTDRDEDLILFWYAGWIGNGVIVDDPEAAILGPLNDFAFASVIYSGEPDVGVGGFAEGTDEAGPIGDITGTHFLGDTIRWTTAVHAIHSALSDSVSPAVRTARASHANPTVRLGPIIAEDQVIARSAVVAPTVFLGSTTATGVAGAAGDTQPPITATSSVVLTPEIASASAIVVSPMITAELIAAPAAVEASGDTLIESATISSGPLFSPEFPLSNVWTPQEPLE
jgi:hypothetical protein